MTGRLKVLLTRKAMHALKINNLSDILDGIWRGEDQQKWGSLHQLKKKIVKWKKIQTVWIPNQIVWFGPVVEAWRDKLGGLLGAGDHQILEKYA